MAEKGLEYKIFASEEWDWFVASKKGGKKPLVLYEGHDLKDAYKSILEDMGFNIPVEKRDMADTGGYEPVKKDFAE
ncbi:MAG: hypothetical protein WC852_04090 [Candidatus Nanoarchaeia archaeon]|jgi:hypothetical protein